jgi:hypothetical protein
LITGRMTEAEEVAALIAFLPSDVAERVIARADGLATGLRRWSRAA